MSRNPVSTQLRNNYRFIATHPDASVKTGSWTESETEANQQATEYAKGWLSSVKRLGLEGQEVRVAIQTMTQEVRVFQSKPKLAAEYSQIETDRYGNVWGIK